MAWGGASSSGGELPAPVPPNKDERYGAADKDLTECRHQGAENSPWKNSAPRSLTARKTSDSTSMHIVSLKTGVCAKNTGRSVKYERPWGPHSGTVKEGSI